MNYAKKSKNAIFLYLVLLSLIGLFSYLTYYCINLDGKYKYFILGFIMAPILIALIVTLVGCIDQHKSVEKIKLLDDDNCDNKTISQLKSKIEYKVTEYLFNHPELKGNIKITIEISEVDKNHNLREKILTKLIINNEDISTQKIQIQGSENKNQATFLDPAITKYSYSCIIKNIRHLGDAKIIDRNPTCMKNIGNFLSKTLKFESKKTIQYESAKLTFNDALPSYDSLEFPVNIHGASPVVTRKS